MVNTRVYNIYIYNIYIHIFIYIYIYTHTKYKFRFKWLINDKSEIYKTLTIHVLHAGVRS